jgi:outer membrane protein insertion porin family
MFPLPVNSSSYRTRAAIVSVAAGIAICLPSAPALAQPGAQVQPSDGFAAYEGRPIREIVIQGYTVRNDDQIELSDELRQTAANNIRSSVGGAFRAATVRSDVTRLNRLNVFGSVDASVQLLDDGSVRLIFALAEQPVIEAVQVSGNMEMTDQKIYDEIDLVIGGPVDRFQVDRAARKIENLYREKGYYFARVVVDSRELDENGIVVYQIREGERVKITDIRFEGNNSFESRELRREVETRTANLFKKGQIDDNELDNDVGSLIQFYRNHGFLDVRAGYRIQPAPNGKEAIIIFLVEEGNLFSLRDVRVSYSDSEPEHQLLDNAQVKGLLDVKRGDVYGVIKVDAAIQRVTTAFGAQGYTEVKVMRQELRDPDRPQVDLLLEIRQGPRYKTGLIVTAGNDITRKRVIMRNIELKPGRPLDSTAIEASRNRLRQLNIFAPGSVKITPQPPDPDNPEYRDILVEVDETNTGQFTFGGAVSSDAGVTGRIAVVQRNFDLMDWPETPGEMTSGRAWRGGGQTFRAELLPGDRIETYSISLTEPHLGDTNYSGTVQMFYRSRDFDEFDELRFGTRMSLGRRFGTRWAGAINLRLESVDLSAVAPDRPNDIFAVADQNGLSGLGVTLTRTSIDDRFRPTRGSTTSFSIEQIGALGGDFNFTKFTADHTVFIPIFEDYLSRRTVLSFKTKIGYIPQGRSDTPAYERFYLGGSKFRGFQFRTVSPKGVRHDNGLPSPDSVGGNYMFFAGAEIQHPIFEEMFSIVGFIDTGTVTFDPGFDDYRVSVGFGFRFSIPQLSPAPLAFDFGIPVLKGPGDEKRLFTFSIDLPF